MWRPWHPTFSIHFVCFFEIGTKCRLAEASSLSLNLRVIDLCCFLWSKSDCQCQLIMLLFCTPCQSLFKGLLDLHVCLSTPNPLIHPAAIQATVQMHKFSQLGQMIVRLHQCCSFSTTLILVTLLFYTTLWICKTMVRQFLLFEVYKFSYQFSFLKQLSGPIEGKRGEIAVFTPVTRSSRSSKLPSEAIPYSVFRLGQHPTLF